MALAMGSAVWFSLVVGPPEGLGRLEVAGYVMNVLSFEVIVGFPCDEELEAVSVVYQHRDDGPPDTSLFAFARLPAGALRRSRPADFPPSPPRA